MNAQVSEGVYDIYARISKAPDGSIEKTSRQIADCKAELERRGLTLGEVFEDPNLSAWRKGVRRPGWDQQLMRAQSGAAQGFIVWKLDRFTRRLDDLLTLRDLAQDGFTILTCMEGSYDFERNWSATLFRVHMNEEASKDTSTRTKRGLEARRLAGHPHTGPRAFGWPGTDADGNRVHPATVARERRAIAEAARRYLSGDQLSAIARTFNERGILTATGGPWKGSTIRQMLLRPSNAGRVVHDGVLVSRIPGEPALSDEDFDLIVARFTASRRGRPVSDARLLTGIAHCGHCGRHLNSRQRAGRYYADGEPRVMYYCPWPRGCGKVAIQAAAADKALRGFVVARLSDPRHAEQIEARAAAAKTVADEIATVEATATALAAKLGEGEISLDAFNAANGPLRRRLAALTAKAEGIGKPPKAAESGAATAVAARWGKAGHEDKRAMLKAALGEQKLFVDPVPDGRHWRQLTVTDRLRVE